MFAPEQKIRSLPLVMNHRAHLRVLEADSLQRIVQFDVHTQIVGIEFEAIAGTNAGFFVDIHRQRGNASLDRQPPVPVARGMRLEAHRLRRRLGHRSCGSAMAPPS